MSDQELQFATTPTGTELKTLTDGERVIEAVYNINTHAKRYAELGTENYRRGKKATAKQNSVKKNALYAVKERVIRGFVEADEHARVTKHRINGDVFVCHYFEFEEEWSFHTPIDAWRGAVVECEVTPLPGFESDGEKTRSDMSLKDALLLIESETGVNANAFLEQEYVQYGSNRYFTGWSFLGDE
jgi:hypothetical protein